MANQAQPCQGLILVICARFILSDGVHVNETNSPCPLRAYILVGETDHKKRSEIKCSVFEKNKVG